MRNITTSPGGKIVSDLASSIVDMRDVFAFAIIPFFDAATGLVHHCLDLDRVGCRMSSVEIS